MRTTRTVGRAFALVPLLTACVTLAGGNPDDVAEPSSGMTAETRMDRETTSEASQTAQPAAGDSGSVDSRADGPLQNVPLVIDLSDLSDPDGLGTPSIQWQAFNAERGSWRKIDGATRQTFTPRQTHVGSRLRVMIEYVDGGGTLESITTQPTSPVRNVNDVPTGQLQLRGIQAQNETLRADISAIRDVDGIGPLNYRWEISSDGSTWQRYRGNDWRGDTITLTQDEVGRYLRAVVSYVDGFGAEERIESAATDPIRNVNDPVQGELLIDGPTRVGDTLRADTSRISDRDGIADISLVWEASEDGRTWRQAAESATRSLPLDRQLAGQQIRARANVVDDFGNTGTVLSSTVGPVEAVNRAPSGDLEIRSLD
ncbi:hypothetical protein [Spiribacter roseus]|uniref:hypothetical protein n=1 Tax=Spiribacter roseus TaxID=1855875 RepID=UPI0012FDD41E